MDPIRRSHVIDGLLELVKLHETDLASVQAGAEDLLRRARVSWADLLVHDVVPADPLPVRQANVMAGVIHQCRGHAEPGDLPLAAIWHREAPKNPEFAELLRTLMSRLFLREEAELEALRVAIETRDEATAAAICEQRRPFNSIPGMEIEPTLVSMAVEGSR